MNYHLVFLLLTATSAASAQMLSAASLQSPNKACMYTTQPQSWRVLDSQHLVLWGTSQQDIYLVTLFTPISDLRSNEVLAFIDSDRNQKLCGDGADKIAAPNSKTDPQPTNITAMTKLEERDLISLGKQYNLQLLSPARIKALSQSAD